MNLNKNQKLKFLIHLPCFVVMVTEQFTQNPKILAEAKVSDPSRGKNNKDHYQ